MKLTIALILSVSSLTLGRIIPLSDERIVGGVETTIEEHPYQVSVDLRNRHNCGGSILNEYTILTAGHCGRYSAKDLSVRVGATIHYEGEYHAVAQVIVHEDYVGLNNDIAVLKLSSPLKFNEKVQPIKLQPANTPVLPGTSAYVTGWGATYWGDPITPDILRGVDVEVISNEKCRDIYKPQGYDVTDSMLCTLTPGQGSCQGDSGGPLVANGRVIGAVSWAIGCAGNVYPTVFANVTHLNDFIKQHL